MTFPVQDVHGPALFEAVITPHRSLSPAGMRWVLGILAVLTGLICLRFWAIGAWPVIGFGVIEIALVGLLFTLNHRSARACEWILLHATSLRVVRVDPSGTMREKVLPSAWLRVRLDEEPRRVSRLFLCSRHASEEIGTYLGETEKRDLARALRSALHEAQNPRFDNPQLRA
ncbi:MAG: DUF2244 domain-containing protein [Acetobacteraceae bacterium]